MIKKMLVSCLSAKNQIETLKEMPQRIERGVVYNFHNQPLFNVTNEDTLILGASRVGSRFTDALCTVYKNELAKVEFQFGEGTDAVAESTDGIDPLYESVVSAVDAGDKKRVRELCKELKEKWFALDGDDVEDAIDDIKDCLSDKDGNAALDIINDLVGEDTPEVTEILEDLESAIKDDDKKDIKVCLEDLADEVGEDSHLYKEWLAKTDTPAEDELADEIIEDIEAALKADDLEEAKECLEELADELGEDSDLYKKWDTKVNPPKKERKRRGNR